jgi:hypothetical protein
MGVMAVACGDSSGPSTPPVLNNPGTVTQEVGALSAPFQQSAPLSSFGALTSAINFGALPSPPALDRMRALVSATAPRPLGARRDEAYYAARARYARNIRNLVPAIAAGPRLGTNAAIIPAQYLGLTFEWSVTTHAYANLGATGAPANGVRFIVYQLDSNTGAPDEANLTEIARLDVADLSPAGPAAAGLNIKLFEGGTTYVDYDVSAAVNPAAQSFTATSTGYVTDGTARLDFQASIVASQTSVTFDVSKFDYDADGNSTLDGRATIHENIVLDTLNQTATFTFLFTFQGSGQSISAGGTVTVVTVQTQTTVTLAVVLKVGGATYATLTGTLSAPVLKDAKGQAITDTNVQGALGAVFDGASAVGDEVAKISSPALDLLPGGDSISPGF